LPESATDQEEKSMRKKKTQLIFGSLPLFGLLDSPFAFPTVSEPHQGSLASEPSPPVFKQTRVRLFGQHQSSNERSHHCKRTELTVEADQGTFKSDQLAPV